jgi:hypothetical protein
MRAEGLNGVWFFKFFGGVILLVRNYWLMKELRTRKSG